MAAKIQTYSKPSHTSSGFKLGFTAEDRAAIVWLAVCKHIRFAFEFAAEVLREKLLAHDAVLRNSDYESCVESKSVSHPVLTQGGPSRA